MCRLASSMARENSLRLLVFLIALAAILLRFVAVPAPESTGDPTLIPELTSLVKTAAAGHPLQIEPGVSVNKAGYDPGMFFYPSVALTLLKGRIPADLSVWLWLQLGFLVCGCALLLMPGVPLEIGAGAVAALAGAVVVGDNPLPDMFSFHYYGYWAPPLAALVTLVWLLALPDAPRRVTVAVGLFVGALSEWRVDAGAVPCVAALGLAGVLGARRLAAGAQVEQARRGVAVLLACLAFVALTRVPDLAVRATLGVHQAVSGVRHFAGEHKKGHMLWHNLYLSYGSDELNSRHIEWDDAIGWLHAAEYDPGMAGLPGDGALSAAHDAALRGLYLRTAFDDPALWLRAAGSRAAQLADRIGWPWIGLALCALVLGWGLAWSGQPLALALPWGRVRLVFEGTQAVTGWGHGPLVCALVIGAAALPPLLYNALPWYTRAAQMAVRVTPLLLALGIAARAAAARAEVTATPVIDRLVLRAAGRLACAGAGALVIFLAAGQLHRACAVRHDVADLDALIRQWDADPRSLRVRLAETSPDVASRIVEQILRRHGPVKGGGQVLQFPDEARAGQVRVAAWVRGHLLIAYRSAAAWPGNGLLRVHGGWADLDFQGARSFRYRVRIPPFTPDCDLLWMIPVAPHQPDPLTVTVQLREFGLRYQDPGVLVARLVDLKRTPTW